MSCKSLRHALVILRRVWSAGDNRVCSRDILASSGIPKHYIHKITSQLVKAGILDAKSGQCGGFKLAARGREISVWEVGIALGLFHEVAPTDTATVESVVLHIAHTKIRDALSTTYPLRYAKR